MEGITVQQVINGHNTDIPERRDPKRARVSKSFSGITTRNQSPNIYAALVTPRDAERPFCEKHPIYQEVIITTRIEM